MPPLNILIRPETPEDFSVLKKLLDSAFEQPDESFMVERLRHSADYIPELSLVAFHEGRPVGCIYFSHAVIRSEKRETRVLCLAPMAVFPAYQRKGIGGLLIREGLRRAKEIGYAAVTVIGHPSYYPRFGFEISSRWGICVAFPVPEEALMALELKEGALKEAGGRLYFSECFEV
jgi:putative acetyltransferase